MKTKKSPARTKFVPLKENFGWVGATESIIDLFHDDYRRRRHPLRVLHPCLVAATPPRTHRNAALRPPRPSALRRRHRVTSPAAFRVDLDCVYLTTAAAATRQRGARDEGGRDGGRGGGCCRWRGGGRSLGRMLHCTDYIPPSIVHRSDGRKERRSDGRFGFAADGKGKGRGRDKRDFSH